MSSLWHNDDPAAWRQALHDYPRVLAAQAEPKLLDLDRFYREQLPAALATRSPPAITRDELVHVTEWKMRRGEYRARNLMLVRSNTEAEIHAASLAGFAAIPDPRRPIKELIALAGVGPATASAVLAAARPDLYPFFDEVVARQIPDLGPVAFTLPYYIRYATRLRDRALALGHSLGPHDLAQALWSAAGGKPKP